MKKLSISILLIAILAVTSGLWANGSMQASTPWARAIPVELTERKVTLNSENGLAFMEVEDTFINTSNIQCEGVYSFDLPAGGFVSGFWINTDEENWVKGEIKEIEQAREIYHSITERLIDPGLLEQKDGQIIIRVFPIDRQKKVGIRFRCFFPATGSGNDYQLQLPLGFSPVAAAGSDLRREAPQPVNFSLAATINESQGLQNVSMSAEQARIKTKPKQANINYSSTAPELADLQISWQSSSEANPIINAYQVVDGGKFSMIRINKLPLAQVSTDEKTNFIVDMSGSMGPLNQQRGVKFIEQFNAGGGQSGQISMLKEGALIKTDLAGLADANPYGPTSWQALSSVDSEAAHVIITDGNGLRHDRLHGMWKKIGKKPLWLVLTGREKADKRLAAIAENYGGLINYRRATTETQLKEKADKVVRLIAAAPTLYDQKDRLYLPLFGSPTDRAYYVMPFKAGQYKVKARTGAELLSFAIDSELEPQSISPWFVSMVARAQIKVLESLEQSEKVVKMITELGLKYNQATDYTAFLAVPDEIAKRNADVMNPAYLAMFAAPNFRKARAQSRLKACYANQRVLLGAIEMYLMDKSDSSGLKWDLYTGNIDLDVLVEGQYLRSPLRGPNQECEYRMLGDPMEDGEPLCLLHGSVSDNEESVAESIEKYCEKHNLKVEDFKIPTEIWGTVAGMDPTGFETLFRSLQPMINLLSLLL